MTFCGTTYLQSAFVATTAHGLPARFYTSVVADSRKVILQASICFRFILTLRYDHSSIGIVMRFQFLNRWFPGRRGWWLFVTLVVVIAGLAIGSRWLPEIDSWRPPGDQTAGGRTAGEADTKATTERRCPRRARRGEEASHAGEAADAHAGEAADAHAGEAADAHAGEGHADEKDALLSSQAADHKHEEAAAVKLSPRLREMWG